MMFGSYLSTNNRNSLEVLDLQGIDGEGLGENGCLSIAENLPPSLTTLHLEGVRIEKGAFFEALAQRLPSSGLRELYVERNDLSIPTSAKESLARALKDSNVTRLQLDLTLAELKSGLFASANNSAGDRICVAAHVPIVSSTQHICDLYKYEYNNKTGSISTADQLQFRALLETHC